jgi:hypothetical protein
VKLQKGGEGGRGGGLTVKEEKRPISQKKWGQKVTA